MLKNREECINSFWNSAYQEIDDGGYLSDNKLINQYRFLVEKNDLIIFIEKYTSKDKRGRALDIGCGNGKFTEVMSDYFEQVDAIDLSEEIIAKNKENTQGNNCHYFCDSLESFTQREISTYDFIYVGGVLMYIEESKLKESYHHLDMLMNANAILVLRESVMTKQRVDNISDKYIAYYRKYNAYQKFFNAKLLEKKENLSYRTSELRNVLIRLKMGFLFSSKLYAKLLILLKLKDKLWKPHLNKLVNYYYVFRKIDS